jgi:hypothetical protein
MNALRHLDFDDALALVAITLFSATVLLWAGVISGAL